MKDHQGLLGNLIPGISVLPVFVIRFSTVRSLNLMRLCCHLFFFSDAGWAGRGDIVMSASDTQAAFMVPVSSHGSATARKAGVAFSATRVSSQSLPKHLV